jgi:hypothetical protein
MKPNHRRVVCHSRVPVADAALRESVLRVTARDTRTWGFVLAKVRAARKWSLTTLAMALGVPSDSALVFLSVCRLPRAGRFEEDLVAVAERMGVPAAVLRFVLDLTNEARVANGGTTTGGAA